MTFGDKLRKYRKSKGMTQTELAKAIGVNVYSIKMWETDKYEPTVKNLKEICRVLGVTAQALCEGEVVAEQVIVPGRAEFIDEVMSMPEEHFRRILKYSEFLKKESSRSEGGSES